MAWPSVTHPLLFHELAIGTVVDNIPSEDRRGQDAIDLFGVDVLGLAIENEFVALGADVDGGLFAEEDKSEDIAKLHMSRISLASSNERKEWSDLFAVLDEESRRVHAIGYGAANDGEPVEDDGRLIGVLEEKLLGDIDGDGQRNEGGEDSPYLGCC